MTSREGISRREDSIATRAISDPCLVLQARMGSTRFPGKMLTDIAGRTLLERVMRRLEQDWDGPRVIAIPEADRDTPMGDFASGRGWLVFRGSETDVLGRFAGAVRAFGLERVIRVCGDNPLIEADCVRRVAEALGDHDVVRASGWPLGTAVEGASARALLDADREATEPSDREHVMPWIYRNAARYRFRAVESSAYPAARLTTDTAEDIALFRRIFSRLGDDPLLADVLDLLRTDS